MISFFHGIVVVVDASNASYSIPAGFLLRLSPSSIQEQQTNRILQQQQQQQHGGLDNRASTAFVKRKNLQHHRKSKTRATKTTAYSSSSFVTSDFDSLLSAVEYDDDNNLQYLKGIQNPNEIICGYTAMEAYRDIDYVQAETDFVASLRAAAGKNNNWHWTTSNVAASNIQNMMNFYQQAFIMIHSGCFIKVDDDDDEKYNNIQRSCTIMVGLLSIAGYFQHYYSPSGENNENDSNDDGRHDYHELLDNNPEFILTCEQMLNSQYKNSSPKFAWQCIVDAISSSTTVEEYHTKLFSYAK